MVWSRPICLIVVFLVATAVSSADAEAQSLPTSDLPDSQAAPFGTAGVTFSSIELLDRNLTPVSILTPGDTMYIEVVIADPAGFQTIQAIDFNLYVGGSFGATNQPAFDANLVWRRNGSPNWQVDDPSAPTTWKILPELCVIDSLTNTTAPETVRLSFVPSLVARASNSGAWTIEIDLTRLASPANPWDWEYPFDCAQFVQLVPQDTISWFAPGPAGATGLPITVPLAGAMALGVIANDDFHLKSQVSNFLGVTVPTESLIVVSPSRIRYDVPGGKSGWLLSDMEDLMSSAPPLDQDRPLPVSVFLWIDHPNPQMAQEYIGDYIFRIQTVGGQAATHEDTVSLIANVTGAALAATSAIAEVSPDSVVVGTPAQPFRVSLLPDIQPTDTGINRVVVNIPAGYSIPVVTGVRIGGIPTPYFDLTLDGMLVVDLSPNVMISTLIEIDFMVDTPTVADMIGGPFAVLFEDIFTPVGAQAATEGDANGLPDDDRWVVRVIPGPLAEVEVNPASITTWIDSTTAFSAITRDSFGNVVSAGVSWRTEGAIGTVDPASGVFTATGLGSGLVIAESGGFADTSFVTVMAAAVQVTVAATQSAEVVLPGQDETLILTLAVAHDGGSPLTLENLTLANTTAGSGTQTHLDGEFGLVRLYLDDGDGRIEPGVDSLIGSASVAGGEVQFTSLSLSVPDGAVAGLLVGAQVSLTAADLDTLDLAILDPAAVVFDETVIFLNAWPVSPTGGLAVDGMAAAQIGVGPHTDSFATVGEMGVLALDVTLPANGYHPDTLETVSLINTGTAQPATDIERIQIWRDGGDAQFDGGATDDVLLGEAIRQPQFWSLVGLQQPIPSTGLRIFATAEIAPAATAQTTLNLAIPESPGNGVFVRSGNDGPRDSVVPSGFTVTIQADTTAYLTVLAFEQAGRSLLPGDSSAEIFRLRVVNHWSQPDTLTTLTLTNRTQGSGSGAELDADWGPLTLGIGDGEQTLEKPGLGFAAEASFLADAVTFSGLQLEVPPGDTLTLSVWGGPSLDARDGDLLDLSLEAPGDLIFSPPSTVNGSWPLRPEGVFPVDGMSAAQIAVAPVAFSSFPSGSQRNLALDVVLPPNGYETDFLERLNITNLGTARPGLEIDRLEAWIDGGDGVFDTAVDRNLGEMSFTGDRWEITGISEPIALTGGRVFVSVDISDLAGEGNTIRLALPTGSDLGVGMVSGNDGPLDQQVSNPVAQSISAADRITLTAVPLPPSTVHPGDRDLVLLQLAVANSYSGVKRLNSLAFTNATTGLGTQTELDSEIASLRLRADGNFNGVLDGADPILGAASFVNGHAVFQALNWDVPADSVRTLFLTGDAALASGRDGDVLATVVTDGSEFLFEDATAVVGSWPLDSGARYTLDGMLGEQITNLGAPVATVGPGDGPVPAMDFILPSNGYRTDELNGIRVVNQGTATESEIAAMRLWRDGGDGLFTAGGDDTELATLAWDGAGWQSPFLAETLPAAGTRFFVTADVSGSPADSTTLQLALPLEGVQTDSDNDGPIDLPVENQEAVLISSAPLLATLQVVEPASTIGRQFAIRMVLRNVSAEQIDGITPSALTIAGDGVAAPLSGPLPSTLSLAPGEADTIQWVYTATATGEIQFTGSASGTGQPSGLGRSSAVVRSNLHRIFVEVDNLALFSIESMPFSINRGQTDVVPLNLTLTNYGGEEASDVRVRGLRIYLENENGQGIVPADLLSRVVVNEGTNVYLSKTGLETGGSIVDLTLASPVLVTSKEPVTLSLQLDILASTTVPNFRVVIPDSAQFFAEDATSGAPVDVVLEEGAYPIRSGLARLSAEAVELQVSAVAGVSQRVGAGQTGVPVAGFGLLNAGIDGLSSDVRVVSLEIGLTDDAGTPIADPSQVISRVRVLNFQQVFLDRPVGAEDDTSLTLSLSPLLPVPVNLPLDLTFEVDLHESAPIGSYRIELGDTAWFDARDASGGQRIPVVYQSIPLAGSEFLIESGAEEILVAGSGLFPASAPAGLRALPAIRAVFSHPGTAGTARVRLDGLTIHFLDETRDALVPADYISRIQVLEATAVIAEILNPPTTGGSVQVPLPGRMLEPGQSISMDICVDLQTSAPASFLELTVGADDIVAVDANTTDLLLNNPQAGTSFPVSSSLMQIVTPARNLAVGMESLMPAVLVRDGTETPAAQITLTNSAAPGSGPIYLDRLVIKAADQDGREIAAGAVVQRLSVYHQGGLWGASGTLNADSVTVVVIGSDSLRIEPGSPEILDLRFETRISGNVPGLRLGLDDAGVGVVQPNDPLLFVDTEPQQGQVFPLWTQTGNFSGLSLDESYSNFPNPFAAGRQLTSFVYSLRTGAQVTLKIFTSRGEPVATLVNGLYRPSGLHQDDRWDGRNGNGKTVINGVYIAELTVQYDDGQLEKLRRKVAVLR